MSCTMEVYQDETSNFLNKLYNVKELHDTDASEPYATTAIMGLGDRYEVNGTEMREKDLEKLPPAKKLDDDDGPAPSMTKGQIIKNVFVVSASFCCLFTAFQAISNIQTSLNKEDGIGAISLSLVYASLIVSCLLLPKFVIANLGCKWTLPVAMTGYILYTAANFYAVKGTMFTAAIILGFCAAPLWSAKCTYLTQIGVWYAKLTGQDKDAIINTFFGIFFFFFQSSQIWGNLISSMIFERNYGNETNTTVRCGADFFPGDDKNNTDKFDQPQNTVYTLLGIYLACAVMAAILVITLLDPIKLDKESSDEDKKLNPELLLATLKHLISSPTQMLLIPITIYSGVEQGFFTGDFTKSYVSCSLGIWNVGFVMICYGVVDASCSFLFGRLVKYVGHIPFFFLAFLIHGSMQIVLLLWEPNPDKQYLFYIFAGLWGCGDAVIQTQLNALYGDLFTEKTEEGFANYRLWESVGFTMTFAYNDFLRTSTKLYIVMGILALAIVTYMVVEVTVRNKQRKKKEEK